jgi:hypothetical protein
MPGPRLPMRKIHEVLRLSAAGMSEGKKPQGERDRRWGMHPAGAARGPGLAATGTRLSQRGKRPRPPYHPAMPPGGRGPSRTRLPERLEPQGFVLRRQCVICRVATAGTIAAPLS